MPQQPLDHLTGSIERVTFHSAETGFCVLRVGVRGQREPVAVIGTLPSVSAGEWLDAQGRWAIDPKHGQQFRAEVLRTTHPDTPEGVEKYLASGLVKGIGPKFAARLVGKFGKDVFEVIEKEPARLREVPNGWVPCTHLTGAARQVENGGGRIVFLIGTLDDLRPYLQWA